MKKFATLLGVALLAGSALGAAQAYAADELTITSWGGAYQEAQRKSQFEPYIALGNKITEAEYTGEIAKIRAMVEAKAVTWDVVSVDSQTVLAGCAEGIFETIDWNKLGLDRANFLGSDVTDCGLPTDLYSTVVAFDTTKTKEPADLFEALYDTAKYPGKRALQKNPYMNLEWALMADGVAPGDVYKVLGTEEGVDRAFKKLDTIKKDVVWWDTGAQGPQLLADGQVVFASSWNGRFYKAIMADSKPFKIIWDRQAPDTEFWAITKGTPKLEEAYRFVSFAGQPKQQAEQANNIPYGPSNKDSMALVKPEILPHLPTAPANLNTVFYADQQFWADKGDELRERFNAWLAQ
ncbi:ABC transporter substrate-binding protein [Aestuariivirga sp.]|uniref:ABC transporter substrate-binding protein n=1 Tax=Aestuariivirga sp. TaxID=2650926 RepID=UPI0025C4D507|nr:ABC transporter substrate-binding protein [Aestuariivirga sp.]MCA3555663.1 ABC transporter substrate-binding protein [Aestuariivirga sp.]